MEFFWKLMSSDEVQGMLFKLFMLTLTFIGLKVTQVINRLIKDHEINNAVHNLYTKINGKVLEIYKSSSDDFKEKAKDGNFTAEERKEWIENVNSYAKLTANAELQVLKGIGHDVDIIIRQTAENAWHEIKKKLY